MSPLNFMTEDKDYRFIDSAHDNTHVSIEILKGDFADIKYYYKELSIIEEDDAAILRYDFVIINGNELYESDEELRNDEDFKIVMNKILHKILTEKYAQH
jgi:hypothetical protein